jgi:hypothetical protein
VASRIFGKFVHPCSLLFKFYFITPLASRFVRSNISVIAYLSTCCIRLAAQRTSWNHLSLECKLTLGCAQAIVVARATRGDFRPTNCKHNRHGLVPNWKILWSSTLWLFSLAGRQLVTAFRGSIWPPCSDPLNMSLRHAVTQQHGVTNRNASRDEWEMLTTLSDILATHIQ